MNVAGLLGKEFENPKFTPVFAVNLQSLYHSWSVDFGGYHLISVCTQKRGDRSKFKIAARKEAKISVIIIVFLGLIHCSHPVSNFETVISFSFEIWEVRASTASVYMTYTLVEEGARVG